MIKNNYQKSFLKWVGGKHKLLDHIIPNIPLEIENYHEIFLGGGSVLLAILSLQKQNKIKINKKIYAYDLNNSLINCFKQIQKNPQKIYYLVCAIKKTFLSIETNILLDSEGNAIKGAPKVTKDNFMTTREHYYYWIRNLYNNSSKTSQKSAAYFIFLNKTGFRGMYREGQDGKFNIPYGLKDKKIDPSMISKDEIENISRLIKNVEFICCDFEKSLKNPNLGDFVYLDPPYAPEKDNSFVKYTKKGFNLDTHKSLFKLTKDLNKKNIKFIMSNSAVKLVKDNFEDCTIDDIIRRNAIHSKKPGSKAKEVVIYN